MDFPKGLVFVLLMILVLQCGNGRVPDQKKAPSQPNEQITKGENYCDVHSTVCEFSIKEGGEIIAQGTLNLNPKPVHAMKPIEFDLTLTKSKLQNPEIMLSLTMPAMYMGINKVFLKKISSKDYKGNGMFAECVTEDRRWNIKIVLRENEKTYATDIQFDIIQ
jgi:hypothetical protein